MAEVDIDALWDYADPARSEARFRAALSSAKGGIAVELQTQIARTYSLRRRFDDAHTLLDTVEEAAREGGVPLARYLLERGRTFNSAGEPERARALFIEAWEQAQGYSAIAVDAAHMVAITHAGTDEGIAWNTKALELARATSDRLLPALLNNLGWDLHELGRYEEALAVFQEALVVYTGRGSVSAVQIAQWSVARCLRSLGRYSEALAIQQALAAEHEAAGTTDAYVLEEIAENQKAIENLSLQK